MLGRALWAALACFVLLHRTSSLTADNKHTANIATSSSSQSRLCERRRCEQRLALRGGTDAALGINDNVHADICKQPERVDIGPRWNGMERMTRQESVVSDEVTSWVGKASPTSGYCGPNSVWGVASGDVTRGEEGSKGVVKILTDRVIGNGTFGVVYEGRLENGDTVAVKVVMQDTRIRNRELWTMRSLRHPNVVKLLHFFFTCKQGHSEDVFLNLVMEYVPDTLHRMVKENAKAKKTLPILLTKIYVWQILRSLAYLHRLKICHRDIKPQNVLVNPETHVAKLCDMGSAKKLAEGGTSISYICSRFYRPPELILGATDYTTAVDMWSFGCLFGEVLLGRPLFAGESSAHQFASICRVIGVPDEDALRRMKVNTTEADLSSWGNGKYSLAAKADGWKCLTVANAPKEAIDLLKEVLVHSPDKRKTAIECLAHPFFDELRVPSATCPDGKAFPPLFAFTVEELSWAREMNLLERILPQFSIRDATPVTSSNVTPSPITSRAASPGL